MVLSQLLPWFLLLGAIKFVESYFQGSRKKSRRASPRPQQRNLQSSSPTTQHGSSAASAKGWLGELETRFILSLDLPEADYQRVHNVVIPAENGTTQIDHLLVSIYGIFVIETKNMEGWIFGAEQDRQWTQSIFGKKYRFQNPLHQNYRHTRCLSAFLDLNHELFHSVVFFVGECTFKTEVPRNVLNGGLTPYIRSFQSPRLTPDKVAEVVRRLTTTKSDVTLSNRQHVHSLNVRFSSETTCPKCSGTLVRRTARTGKNAGNSFTGCGNYPRCKFTRPVVC